MCGFTLFQFNTVDVIVQILSVCICKILNKIATHPIKRSEKNTYFYKLVHLNEQANLKGKKERRRERDKQKYIKTYTQPYVHKEREKESLLSFIYIHEIIVFYVCDLSARSNCFKNSINWYINKKKQHHLKRVRIHSRVRYPQHTADTLIDTYQKTRPEHTKKKRIGKNNEFLIKATIGR